MKAIILGIAYVSIASSMAFGEKSIHYQIISNLDE